jgi:ribonucleotide reductase alpha subunit
MEETTPQISKMENEPRGEYVLKRNGTREAINPSKITRRLQKLKADVESFLGRKLNVSVWRISQAVIGQIYDGITTSELDEEAAEVAAYITDHPDYADFAGQILVSNLEANNRDCMNFLAYAEKAYNFTEEKTGKTYHLISDEVLAIARKFSHHIDRRLVMNRNYMYDYFAFQTLVKGQYLLQTYKTIQKNKTLRRVRVPFESPQHMWMRVAIGIHGWNIEEAFELYDHMSLNFGTMATPTLFNSGTPHQQNSSCFLLTMKDDSIEGIFDTLKQTAQISKQAGGIGLSVHNIRSSGSYIQGTNGTSNGLVPMLRVFNNTAKYVDQGGGKRKGSFAIYLEPWHADIFEFLDLKRPHGAEDERARDLFYGLWIPDLFWKRVDLAYSRQDADDSKDPVMWSLMCPDTCKGLSDVYGEKFEALYLKYEAEKKYVRQVPIKSLMTAILSAQIETGTPYMLNKDHCNRKSNQKNLGTIKSSNLCVAGDTFILTKEHGQVPIKNVVDKELHVWNGEQWSKTMVKQTSESSKLWRVLCSNGAELYCTEYHKFFIQNEQGLVEKIDAGDLQKGMKIPTYRLNEGSDINISIESSEITLLDEPTYCFTEPLKNAGIFNGILTGNCTEIVEYTSEDQVAVCNLASLSLPAFVNTETKEFDYKALYKATRIFTKATNRIIDINEYPVKEAKYSNFRNRPVGLGVQGLADVFLKMRLRFGGQGSKEVNRNIFETIYFAALEESHALTQAVDPETKQKVGPYPSIDDNGGAPIRHGIFQFDMWKDDFKDDSNPDGWKPNPKLGWDWEGLRKKIMKDGVRNSLLVAPMPTASTSQILGNTESTEPYFGMIYARKTKAGEFFQYCRPLIEELVARGLWSSELHPQTKKYYIPMKEKLKAEKGSIQNIAEIPQDMKDLYVGVFDLKLKDLTDMARDRAVFIDQSMSLNVYFQNQDNMMPQLLKYHTYAWKLGLKTGSYYVRTRQKMEALDFSGITVNEPECVSCSA